MVRIVGTDFSRIKFTTCDKCSSILEYTVNDVKSFTPEYDYGDADPVHYIVCPKCKTNPRVDAP